MKHLANIITAMRIAAAIVMLFFLPLTFPIPDTGTFWIPEWGAFFVFYTVCGVSDMVDGTVARKLGTAGGFGAKLDSVADFVFFLSAAFKLLPALWSVLPVVSLWLVAAIAIIKATSAVIGAVRFHKPCFLHTYLNKLTGAAVFLLPYFYRAGFFHTLIYIVCAVALLASIEELMCLIKMKRYNAEIKGLLFH